MTFADFKIHCYRLANILGNTSLASDWEDVAEWLYLASAIKNVEVDTIQFDNGFGYCSAADYFSMAREELLNKFILSISRFNFVWGSLEACLNTLKLPKHPDKSKQGKISNASYFLKVYYLKTPFPPPLLLEDEVESFKLSAKECLGYESVDRRFKNAGNFGMGMGLYTVYELRNKFSHGSLRFPYPDDENQPSSEHQNMIESATRIVLLSIQMLLLAHYEHSDLEIPYPYNLELDIDEVALWIALNECHLDRDFSELQMLLF